MQHDYFPMGSRRLRRIENSLRKRCANLPEEKLQAVYGQFTRWMPGLEPSRFALNGQTVDVAQKGRTIAFPRPMPLIKYSHVAFGYEEILKRKYSLPGFVEVASNDIVVDCGAFVGGFSLSAARIAEEVHLFEPSAANASAIRQNFSQSTNIVVNECGLFSEDKEMVLNLSSSAVEHSLLQPDEGGIIESLTIKVRRLDTYFNSQKASPDFVKIEAEGVELEVLEGLGDLRPRQIAIDASPERNGESPIDDLQKALEKNGYDCRRRFFMLFARRA